jgi:hypothetical protein
LHLLFLAHGATSTAHVHGSRTPWVVAVAVSAVVLLGLIAFFGSRWERQFRYLMEKGKRSRQPEFQDWIRARRIGLGVAGLAVLAGGVVAGVILSRPPSTPAVSGPPPAVSTPTPGTPYAIDFIESSAAGEIVAEISNRTDRDAFVECFIDALDEQGKSILTGSYLAVDEEGNEFQSRVYAARSQLAAGQKQTVEIHLQVTGPVARVTGECFRIPRPETPGPTVTPTSG